MTDDLDKLRAALKAAEPRPDADVKARMIAAAEKNFAAAQGSVAGLRPMSDRPQEVAGFWTRMKAMIGTMTSRPALLATSSFAVLAVAVVITGQNFRDEPGVIQEVDLGQTETTTAEVREDDFADAEVLADAPTVAEVAPMVEMAPAPQVAMKRSQVQDAANMGAVSSVVRLREEAPVMQAPADQFPDSKPNGLKITAEEPVSTFSIDVDTTSYSVMRMATLDGYPIPKEAIRVEELINYFDYEYPQPESLEVPFSTSVSVTQTPWNDGTKLMQIGIQGYDLAPEDRPAMGLVFLIDTSGSMEDPMKLPLLRKSFGMLLNTLRDDDTVAIVTYAGSAGMALEPTAAKDRAAIMGVLDRLSAGGSTAGQAGLQQAYSIAETMQEDGQQARIILATDGDFNVGISDPEALTDYVAEKRETGVFLSVLGFGRGNYMDTTMQAIAQNGNGVAAYIDSLAEAQKVLVEDVTGSLVTIASDVKIQVEFNPAMISEYRLIGYETRALNREDFNDDTVDAGEIGAGHSVTAIYEITPAGSDAELADPLRYGSTTVADASDELAFLKLRYKTPGAAESQLIETPVTEDTRDIAATETGFAAAVAAAGRLMRGESLGAFDLRDARALAEANKGEDRFGYRAEFIKLLRLAESR